MNSNSVGVTSLVYQERRLKDVQLSGTKVSYQGHGSQAALAASLVTNWFS